MTRKLTTKQARFVERYLVHGNATRAAREAGYSGGENALAVCGSQNLRKPKVADAIAEGRGFSMEVAVMDRAERQRVLSGIAREKSRDRMKAIELLGKMDGDYVDRQEVTNKTPPASDGEAKERLRLLRGKLGETG